MIMNLLEKLIKNIEAIENINEANKYEKEAENAVMFLQAMNM